VASSTSMNKYFAWNLQVNRLSNPLDNETIHYDGSYIATIVDNWVVSIGSIEKWWGASWDSSNLLSNNARAPLAFSINRNYSTASELPILNWLGAWSVSSFVAELDDQRAIDKPLLTGVSFSFKPLSSLEVSLRAIGISSSSSIDETPVVNESLVINEIGLTEKHSKQKLMGFDFRWWLPQALTSKRYPSSFYYSATKEQDNNEQNVQLQKPSRLIGFSTSFKVVDSDWRLFLESTDTATSDSLFNNTADVNGYYLPDYRHNQRVIGSTYGNDSKVTSLGIMGNLSQYQTINLKLQKISLNSNNNNITGINNKNEIKRLAISWDYQLGRYNKVSMSFETSGQLFDIGQVNDNDQFQSEKTRLMATWTYLLH